MSNKIVRFFIFSLFLSGLGCNKVPRNILSEKEMRAVLLDMQLAESLISTDYKHINKDTQKEAIYNSIFAKHEINEAKYDSSLLWYGRNLDIYMRVYENVVKDLEKNKLALGDYSIEKKPIRSRDSIQIWEGLKNIKLKDNIQDRTLSFNIKPAEGFMPGSQFLLSMDVWGVPHDTLYHPILNVKIEQKDTTLTFDQTIFEDGLFQALLKSDSSQTVKRIYGSIKLQNLKTVQVADSTAQKDSLLYIEHDYTIYLDSVSLIRYHHNTAVAIKHPNDSIIKTEDK